MVGVRLVTDVARRKVDDGLVGVISILTLAVSVLGFWRFVGDDCELDVICLSRDRARSVVAKLGAQKPRVLSARLADVARVRGLLPLLLPLTLESQLRGDNFDWFGSITATRFFGGVCRKRLCLSPLTDELSLPFSLAQSMPPLQLITVTLPPSCESEHTLNKLELHDANCASWPPELLA